MKHEICAKCGYIHPAADTPHSIDGLLLRQAETDAAIKYLRGISQYPTLYDMPDEIAAAVKMALARGENLAQKTS